MRGSPTNDRPILYRGNTVCKPGTCQTATAPSVPPPSSTSTTTSKPFVFDVASVKPTRPGESWHYGFSPTGYSAAGLTLSRLIYQAYFGFNGASKDAVTGAPDWAEKDLWDIETKVAPEDIEQYQREIRTVDVANPIGRQMLQNLLADRFSLLCIESPRR